MSNYDLRSRRANGEDVLRYAANLAGDPIRLEHTHSTDLYQEQFTGGDHTDSYRQSFITGESSEAQARQRGFRVTDGIVELRARPELRGITRHIGTILLNRQWLRVGQGIKPLRYEIMSKDDSIMVAREMYGTPHDLSGLFTFVAGGPTNRVPVKNNTPEMIRLLDVISMATPLK